METIDLSMNWKQAVEIIIIGLRDGNPKAQKQAIAELRNMAKVADMATGAIQALKAIKARLDGEFDNPALIKYGALDPSEEKDVYRIADQFLKNH